MAAVYPGAIPTTTNVPDLGANLSIGPHTTIHNNLRDEVLAALNELGVAPSAAFATVAARLNSLWEKIGTGAPSAATSFDIAIPASTYVMVRIFVWGQIAAGGPVFLNARVNNDTTAGLHSHVFGQMFSDTAQTAVNGSATEFPIGALNTGVNSSTSELTLFETHTSSNVPFMSKYGLLGATEADIRQGISSGRLTASRLISSLRILPATSTFSGRWFAEGIRL